MSPKPRNKKNRGLPARWRERNGTYYYRVPEGQEHNWDGKKEFTLGKKLSEAYKQYANRIESPEAINNMQDLLDRYALEVLPSKALATQKNEQTYIGRLREVFYDVPVTKVEPQHVYKLMDAAAIKHGGTTANHTVALLSHVFTKGIEWGACHSHPIKGKVIKRTVKVTRRVPELHEITAAVGILTEKQAMLRQYIALKLMTGLRMTDMLSIKRADIKDDGLYVIPSKTAESTGKALIFQYDSENHLWGTLQAIKNDSKYIKSIYLFATRKGQPYIKPDKSCNAFQSMWKRWQDKALKLGVIEHRFSEKSLRNRVGSDAETAEQAAELLAHASTATTRKHYRNAPVKVLPMVKKQ